MSPYLEHIISGSESTHLCSYSSIPRDYNRSTDYKLYIILFDLTRDGDAKTNGG